MSERSRPLDTSSTYLGWGEGEGEGERDDRLVDGRLRVLDDEDEGRAARATEVLAAHRDEDEAIVRDVLDRLLDTCEHVPG